MRLYRTDRGSWFGTQAEAKAEAKTFECNWWIVEVPTDKAGLLGWLNNEPMQNPFSENPTAAPVVHESTLTKPHPWQTIKECAERAPLHDFPVAIAVYQNRIDELL